MEVRTGLAYCTDCQLLSLESRAAWKDLQECPSEFSRPLPVSLLWADSEFRAGGRGWVSGTMTHYSLWG